VGIGFIVLGAALGASAQSTESTTAVKIDGADGVPSTAESFTDAMIQRLGDGIAVAGAILLGGGLLLLVWMTTRSGSRSAGGGAV
jgi:hypothetical protein